MLKISELYFTVILLTISLTTSCYEVSNEPETNNSFKTVLQELPSETCPGIQGGPHPFYVIPMNVDVMELPRDSWDVDGSYNFPNYGNNTRFVYNFYLNSGYQGANFRFSKFSTEIGDTLFIETTANYPPNVPNSVQAALSGTHKSIYVSLYPNQFLDQNQVKFTWIANGNFSNSTGWHIDQATVQCGALTAGQNTSPIYPNHPTHGLLARTNDYIYFNLPYDKNKNYFAHLRHLAGISNTNSYDFDIYIKRGYSSIPIYPSATNYEFIGSKGTNNNIPLDEMVKVPTTTTNFDTLWIAVRSYNGRGHFQLNVNKVIQERIVETHISDWPPSVTRIAQLKSMSRALYAATEGQLWIKEFKIYQNEADCTNVYCDLYIKNTAIDGNGGTCRTSGGEYRISIETSLTPGLAGQIFNHEAGHCWFEYLSKEEYVTASGSIFYQMSTCGHSAMGAADAHRWGATKDFCRSSDHGEDPATNVGDIGPSGSEYLHLWYYLNSSGIPTTQFISTTGTNSNPDPYDYYQKDPSNLTASENLREADILFAPFININTVPD